MVANGAVYINTNRWPVKSGSNSLERQKASVPFAGYLDQNSLK